MPSSSVQDDTILLHIHGSVGSGRIIKDVVHRRVVVVSWVVRIVEERVLYINLHQERRAVEVT